MKNKEYSFSTNCCNYLCCYFSLAQFGVLSRHTQSLLVPIGVNIILAVSLNLTVGFLGELTLGHAGFMSVGAYAGCLLQFIVIYRYG